MAFHYEIDFKHNDSNGNTLFRRMLAGSHRLALAGVAAPLDVSLEEIPATNGVEPGKFRLTLTNTADGPRSGIIGTWPYEIFFDHQRKDGVIDEAVLASGSHFTKMNPQTAELEVALDELVSKDGLDPRLHFVLKDK